MEYSSPFDFFQLFRKVKTIFSCWADLNKWPWSAGAWRTGKRVVVALKDRALHEQLSPPEPPPVFSPVVTRTLTRCCVTVGPLPNPTSVARVCSYFNLDTDHSYITPLG